MPSLYQTTVAVHFPVQDVLGERLPLYFQECGNEIIRALHVNYEQLTTFLHYYCSMTEACFIQFIRCRIHVPVIIWRTLYHCWCAECCRLTWADSLSMLVFSIEGHNQSGAALLQICIQPVVMNVKSWYSFFPQGLCSLLLSMVISFHDMSTDMQLNSKMSILQNAAATFYINVLLTKFCVCWGWESPSCQKSYNVANSPSTFWMLCMQYVNWNWNCIIRHVL